MSGAPVAALQTALAAEHAAVWGYGLASAYLPAELAGQLAEALAAHRARRDATERLLRDAGAAPAPAEPGYLTPEPVTDSASALRLAVTLEHDSAVAWRSVLERSPEEPVPGVPGAQSSDGQSSDGQAPDGLAGNGAGQDGSGATRQGVRPGALDALVTAAVRAARWRASAGGERPTVAFPGVP